MADDVSLFRERANAERQAAQDAPLQNVRDRCERAAVAWSAMADRADRITRERRAREAATAMKAVAQEAAE